MEGKITETTGLIDRQNLNRISYTITNNNDIIKYNYIIIKFTFSYVYMLLHCILVAYSLLVTDIVLIVY